MKTVSPNYFSARGFTLVELSVSLAIMSILTGVLLVNYPETATRLTLANNSRSVALLIREAQVRGSAIDSGNTTIGAGVESPLGGYGVYFESSLPNKVILFGDTIDDTVLKPFGLSVGNGLYESGPPIDEKKSITTLPTGYVISKLCVKSGSQFSCNSDNIDGIPTITSLTISFTRPNPQPDIYINNPPLSTNFSAACIEIRSPRAPLSGHIRSIQIFNSGMIRTQVMACN